MWPVLLRLILSGLILCHVASQSAVAQDAAPVGIVDSAKAELNEVPHGLKSRTWKNKVEVAPDKWVTVEQTDLSYDESISLRIPKNKLPAERTRLSIPWIDRQVVWDTASIPFSLRESDGVLFIIGFDRDTDFEKPRFRYYRQDGSAFEEIEPDTFPKAIATQNMWLNPDSKSRGMDGKLHYELQMARDIDAEDVYFYRSLTARVWMHLATGKDYHEQDHSADAETVKAFKHMNSPVPIPTIVKTPAGWPREK